MSVPLSNAKKLVILPGDGVGPEVIEQTVNVLDYFKDNHALACDSVQHDYGFHVFKQVGQLFRETTLTDVLESDAVLFGAMGGPEYDDVPTPVRRNGSVLRFRRELKVFANLRPARGMVEAADALPFKREVIDGADLLLVREANGGIYFGEPRGIEDLGNGQQRGFNTEVYTTAEIERVARVAFEIARTRRNHVTSVDKSNVIEAGALWRQVVTRLHAAEYPDVRLSHMLVDNCAMQLARAPKQFDVMVMSNIFGDILSDGAAAIMGSLGMAPSASISAPDENGRRKALYEPVHGSAPDIAGQGIANPVGAIWSFALAMRHTFDRPDDAARIENAIWRTLASGKRTADIAGNHKPVSTEEMGAAILAEIRAG